VHCFCLVCLGRELPHHICIKQRQQLSHRSAFFVATGRSCGNIAAAGSMASTSHVQVDHDIGLESIRTVHNYDGPHDNFGASKGATASVTGNSRSLLPLSPTSPSTLSSLCWWILNVAWIYHQPPSRLSLRPRSDADASGQSRKHTHIAAGHMRVNAETYWSCTASARMCVHRSVVRR